jgi:hypothetical protein
MIDIDLQLFKNVIKEGRHNPDLLDSYSENQFKAKELLVKHIESLNILNENSEVVIFGCWYGSLLIPAFKKVKRITAIDIDDKVIRIAKNRLFYHYKNVDYITSDIFSQNRSIYLTANLFINTSCEHMRSMKEWPYWDKVNKNSYFAFISNNMDHIDGHINCVYSLDEFKTQLPQNFTVLDGTEISEERGTKYLLVGKISS